MILTDADIKVMWNSIFSKNHGKLELKQAGLPSRSQRRDIFQGIEDWFEAQGESKEAAIRDGILAPRTPVQTIVANVMGRSTSIDATGKFYRAYTDWKLRQR